MRADKIRPSHVQSAVEFWRTKLSPRGVLHVLSELRGIFAWGIGMEVLYSNPASIVRAPRAEHKEQRTLDEQGVTKLLVAASGNSMQPVIGLMLLTGLRRGEALGLKWGDFDSSRGLLSVRRSLESHKGALRAKAPKTARSARTNVLAAQAVQLLEKHREQQFNLRTAMGSEGIGPDGDQM